MSTDPNDLSDTIVPKSDQLNADDLLVGPITVTVQGVSRGDGKDQPVSIAIDGNRQPYKPCKSMRRVLIAAWGNDGRRWVGRRMTLYCDPEVKFGGVKVGGIRISHLSDIPGERTFLLTSSRSKRSEFRVQPLAAGEQSQQPRQLTEEEAEYVKTIMDQIANAEDHQALVLLGTQLKEESEAVRGAVRDAYMQRSHELAEADE